MTTKDLFDAWVESIGVYEGVLDDSGRCCSFVYKGEFSVSVEAPLYCDDIFIVIKMMEIGVGEVRRKRLELAMQLNAYGLETRGGILGWDIIGECVILSLRVTAKNTTKKVFDNIISNLLDVAKCIKPRLAMEREEEIQNKVESEIVDVFGQ